MKRLMFAVTVVLVAFTVIPPAGAEPQQGATSAGVVRLRVTDASGSVTWGPWRFTGVWRTDDGATFAGRASSAGVTTSPPTPSFVIPTFDVSGSNTTGALEATCEGSVINSAPRVLEISSYCVDDITGAALAGEDSQTLVLAAVHRQRTPAGVVTVYRGTWVPVATG